MSCNTPSGLFWTCVPDNVRPDFLALLRTLLEHRVDFIVVGGVCAVLHGAPMTTFDLDVVHSRSPENIERLLSALDSLNAYYRTHPGKRLLPTSSHLTSPGHQLLMTRFGPLDLLGSLAGGRSYGDLLPETIILPVGESLSVRVLNLEMLIQVKEETGQDKDKAVLPLLRQTLRERHEQ